MWKGRSHRRGEISRPVRLMKGRCLGVSDSSAGLQVLPVSKPDSLEACFCFDWAPERHFRGAPLIGRRAETHANRGEKRQTPLFRRARRSADMSAPGVSTCPYKVFTCHSSEQWVTAAGVPLVWENRNRDRRESLFSAIRKDSFRRLNVLQALFSSLSTFNCSERESDSL